MGRKVAVVTDTSAMLPTAVADEEGLEVVPLHVVVDTEVYAEGTEEASPDAVLAAMADRRKRVTTSRVTPADLEQRYAALAAEGYTEIVSIHLSAEMSGTFESAQLAARTSPVPVVALDTRAVGPCVGFAVEAALELVRDGRSAQDAADAALARAEATRSYFYVDTLEYLRRGGRVGAAAALLGSALAVKPILAVQDGRVVPHERVRTASRALIRMRDLAVEAAAGNPVEVAVAHLGGAERARTLVDQVEDCLGSCLDDRPVGCGEVGAALGVHVGPGMLAVVVAPAL